VNAKALDDDLTANAVFVTAPLSVEFTCTYKMIFIFVVTRTGRAHMLLTLRL